MTGSSNLTRRRVQQLERSLSDRERSIVESVALLGLMTGEQLCQLHFTGHSSLQSGKRSSQQSLRGLTQREVLTRLERRVGGVRSGSAGYIYALGRAGRQIVDWWRREPTRRSRRTHEPGESFVAHRVACAQLFVDLTRAQAADELRLEQYLGEPDCWRQRVGPFGKPLTLKPDGFARLASEDRLLHWFIEMDLATESQTVIARKGRAYLDHYASGAEADVMPRVIWIAPDPERASRIRSTLHALRGPTAELHFVTTNKHAIRTMKGDFS